jgi:hypothetical protein
MPTQPAPEGCVVTSAATCDHLDVKQSKKKPPKREGFFNQLTRESERGTALVAGEACNERLGVMLERLFVEGSARDLLRHSLGNLSARIDVCFALGLISRDERDGLQSVAKIRTAAAHFVGGSNYFSFGDAATASLYRGMRATSPPFMAQVERDLGPRGQFIGKFIGLFSALETRLNAVTKRDTPT